MWVYLFVCLFVHYRNPTDCNDCRGSSRGEGSGGSTQYPHPLGMGCVKGVRGASGASTMHFGKNFIKQKLKGTPDLVGAGHLLEPQIQIWKDLGPMLFWSHYHSL